MIINPPYKSSNIEGDIEASNQIREKVDKFYQKNSSNISQFSQVGSNSFF